MPGTRSILSVENRFIGNVDILGNLEIEHPRAHKVGPVIEGPTQTRLRIDRSGSKDLESYEWFLKTAHEFYGLLRKQAKHIVVKLVMIQKFLSIHSEIDSALPGQSRPISVVMQC